MRCLSLFSGIGAHDLGLQMAGMTIAGQVAGILGSYFRAISRSLGPLMGCRVQAYMKVPLRFSLIEKSWVSVPSGVRIVARSIIVLPFSTFSMLTCQVSVLCETSSPP